MHNSDFTERVLTLGQRSPRIVRNLRIAIGVWLLAVTALLYSAGVGGEWEWLLVFLAALHFGLAYRLHRVAHQDSSPSMLHS